jgi:RNA polymerase sigma-70 factor (ECF subfamily)
VDLDELARRVADGDDDAFTALVAATTPKLHRLAVRMTGDADDAADLLQEAFLRAHRALGRSRWDGRARVDSWLYRVVVNAALNFRRSQSRQARPQLDATLAPDQESRVAALQAARLLAELPADQRTAFVLKEIEGLTSAEIANLCDCSEGAVEQRLVRARATLKKRWQSE